MNSQSGLNFEIGWYHFNDYDDSKNIKQGYDSYYWLLGPSFIFGNLDLLGKVKHFYFLKLDMVAGTSFKRDVGFILRSDMALTYVFDNGFYGGLGLGGSYLSGQSGKAIIHYSSDTSIHFLIKTGVFF